MSNKSLYWLGIIFAFLNIICVCFNLCLFLMGGATLMGTLIIPVNALLAVIFLIQANSLRKYL